MERNHQLYWMGAAIITVCLFFVPAMSHADELNIPTPPDIATLKANVRVTPDNPWYNLKLATEWFWRDIQFSWEAKVRLLNQHMEERDAEAIIMQEEKGMQSKEYINAIGMYLDYQRQVLDLIKENRPDVSGLPGDSHEPGRA